MPASHIIGVALTFFLPTVISLDSLANHCEASIGNGCGAVEISGAAPIESATNGHVSFIDNPKYLRFLTKTKASAVFCKEQYVGEVPKGVAALVHENPYVAYGKALELIYPTAARPIPVTGETGVSASAHISDDVNLEEDVIIEAGAVIGKGAAIGRGSAILANAVVGAGVQIGRGTTIGCNATLMNSFIGDNVIIHNGVQIGQDGFGFAMGPGGHRKIPQIGRVIIQDGVEVGANSTIDRGANRDTVIGEGTKIDNLVQIGHNCTIGRHCVIVGLAGVSGSATLGDYVVVAGQAGIVGHTQIGDGAQIGGGSGVHGDVGPGEKVMGYPAIPASKWMRQAAKQMLDAKRGKKGGG